MSKAHAASCIVPGDARWDEFLDRLTGPGALDVVGGRWRCAGAEDKAHSRRLLLELGVPPTLLAENLRFFERHGGYCDCEVWMNVERDVARSRVRPSGTCAGDAALRGDEW